MSGPFNLSTLLLDEALVRGDGGRRAIRCDGTPVTYAELAELTGRTAGALRGSGVRRGERVAILIRDRPDFIACFLGAARMGAVAVPLNTQMHADESIGLIQHCGAVVLVAEADLIEELRPHLSSSLALRTILSVGGSASGAVA